MDKIETKHLHLFLDEPIYVLEDKGDHPIDTTTEDTPPAYEGENNKGICVFVPGAIEEDLIFLFKGLNALKVGENDIALFRTDLDSLKEYPEHTKRIRFSTHINLEESFELKQVEGLTSLESIPLKEIRNNQDFKRQFWEALKTLFKAEV